MFTVPNPESQPRTSSRSCGAQTHTRVPATGPRGWLWPSWEPGRAVGSQGPGAGGLRVPVRSLRATQAPLETRAWALHPPPGPPPRVAPVRSLALPSPHGLCDFGHLEWRPSGVFLFG